MRTLRLAGLLAAAACAGASNSPSAARQGTSDLVITNGTIIDGTGDARYRGDVAIIGDRVVRIERGSIPRGSARRTIDASGMIVSPGFIDLHAHLDPVMNMPDAQ